MRTVSPLRGRGTSPGTRLRLRLPVSLLLLVVGAWPSLHLVVDDVYISYTYALRLLAGEGLTWTTGERVEGYSNLLWVLLLATGRVAQLPVTWFSKALSFAAAVGIVGAVHRRAPPTWMGTWLVLAVGGWGALAAWSVLGMETTTFAALLWFGWGAVARPGSTGWVALLLAALTRPEGSLYVVAAALVRRDRRAFGALAALGAYHLARWGYFGALVPNTVLAKSHGSDPVWSGLSQAGVELLVALPVLVAAAATWRGTWRTWGLAWAPLLLHLAMLVRMRGDWMGETRMLLPGIVAGIAVLAYAGVPRPRAGRLLLVLTPLLLLAPLRGPGVALRFRDPVADTLQVPLFEDLQFIVHRIPAGARYETGDVGIPSLVPDLRVVDPVGLTDGAWARAGSDGSPEVDARYAGDDPLACVRRYFKDHLSFSPRFQRFMAPYRVEQTIRAETRRHTWRCRDGLPWADGETVRARWLALVDRLPEHAAIRWHAARMLADDGDLTGATALYAADPVFGDPETALALTLGAVPETIGSRGFVLVPEIAMRSRPVASPTGLVLQTHGPVTLAWVDRDYVELGSEPVSGRVELVPPAGAVRFTVKASKPGVEVWVARSP